MLVAVNHTSFGKDRDSYWAFNNGFTNHDYSARELAVAIFKGRAYCAQHRHDHNPALYVDKEGVTKEGRTAYRHSDNFMASGVLTLDFDGGNQACSINELLRDPTIARYACILYPTCSSTPEKPRTRVVFEIDPIFDLETYRLAQAYLVHLYPTADKSGSDPMKAYSGSPRREPHLELDGRKLPATTVAQYVVGERERTRMAQRASAEALSRMVLSNPQEKLRAALSYISCELDYLDWLKAVICVWTICPDETGIAMLEEWKPAKRNEIRQKFNNLANSGGAKEVDASWIFRCATNRGWQDPDYIAAERKKSVVDMVIDRRRP